jgi:hypothetical protein
MISSNKTGGIMSTFDHYRYLTGLVVLLFSLPGTISTYPDYVKLAAIESNSIHEADEEDLKVLAHVARLQDTIRYQQSFPLHRSKALQLDQLYEELEEIAKDYTQLSPGTAFLGPFSSVSLVLKQRELKKRIAQIEKLIYKN